MSELLMSEAAVQHLLERICGIWLSGRMMSERQLREWREVLLTLDEGLATQAVLRLRRRSEKLPSIARYLDEVEHLTASRAAAELLEAPPQREPDYRSELTGRSYRSDGDCPAPRGFAIAAAEYAAQRRAFGLEPDAHVLELLRSGQLPL